MSEVPLYHEGSQFVGKWEDDLTLLTLFKCVCVWHVRSAGAVLA